MRVLTITYALGVILFGCALLLIGLRTFGVDAPNPTAPLLAGFVLMMGSKIIAQVRRRRVEHR